MPSITSLRNVIKSILTGSECVISTDEEEDDEKMEIENWILLKVNFKDTNFETILMIFIANINILNFNLHNNLMTHQF